jgi:ferredoxin
MLEFNGEKIAATSGETLLQAARRRGAHIWFVCDGRGVCQTCECRILEGAGFLTEPTELERAGLSEDRRRRGYRLACQARLAGTGAVRALSRAEELRRGMAELFSGRGSAAERAGRLGADAFRAAADLLSGVPLVAPRAVFQILAFPPTPARAAAYLRDNLRVASRLWTARG